MDPTDAAGIEPPTTTQPIDMSSLLEHPVPGSEPQHHKTRQNHKTTQRLHGRFAPPGR